jgi:hypothetical protein
VQPSGAAVRQLELGEAATGWRDVEVVADALSDRFGRDALRPAVLVGSVDRPDDPTSRRPRDGR